MKKYKYLFFDLDRTLWDYDTNARRAFQIIYKKYKLDNAFSSSEEFFQKYTIHNDSLWDDYRKGLLIKEELRKKRFILTLSEGGINNEKLAAEIDEQYMTLTHRQDATYPNTFSTLDYLSSEGYQMFILTNGFIKTQQKKMHYSKLEPYFKKLFSSEEIGVNKPKPEIFHWAVSSIHATKKECLMIGDDCEVDILGAMKYGIDAIWFNPSDENRPCRSTHTISDLSELMTIL